MADHDSRCDCGHERRSHANGLWECKWCNCKGFVEPVVPNIFDDDDEPQTPASPVED